MTRPLWKSDRTRLMLGCGSAALALALALVPQGAAAQGIQAAPTVVSGSANVNSPAANTTRIDVNSQTTVINWTPFVDNNGNALSFLPTGSTANFRGTAPNFAVLNRILPTTNNNIAVIDGSVLSQVGNPSSGFTTGGFIAFYSPTGILIGPNAKFDVGSLMLTTLDTTTESFIGFANGGFLSLQGQQGSRATITVSPGAQITATQENSFFTIVAADIEMRGTALVNGSHAYVAGEVVDMRFSNGLFDIFVSAGTAASGEVVTLNGAIGGPSSNGADDNHMIYAVARASQDPISMLLSGNIGFDPAQSAGIINGEIILAANYNVFGRSVGSGAIGEDVEDVTFRRANATSDVRADITLQDFNASSSVLAIGTGRTLATSINANSSVTGNLMLVGRQSAAIDVAGPRSFTVSGDVLVDARDFGVVGGSGLQSLDVINAQGGTAQIRASSPNASVTIGGRAIVTAEAFAGEDFSNGIAGSARGGTAEIVITGGRVSVTGNTKLSAGAFGVLDSTVRTGAEARGGIARFAVSGGGTAELGGDLLINAEAEGSEGEFFSPSTVSNAYGGQAMLTLSDANGTITVGGNASLRADATGGTSSNAGTGSLGDAGDATVAITGSGTFDVTGDLNVFATGTGGTNPVGKGGTGLGGRASIATVSGGTIRVGGRFDANATGFGNDGQSGGDGFGGIAGADAIVGVIDIANRARALSYGYGGFAENGAGGDGGLGQGGYAFLQAQGTLTQSARLSIGGDAFVAVDGYGGGGGNGNDTVAGGRGGDGVGGRPSIVNQADPAFGGGAFLLAGADNGTLIVAGQAQVYAIGDAGRGGNGGFGNPSEFLSVSPFANTDGGRGGDGIGGFGQAGLSLFGLNGSVRAGQVILTGDLEIRADGYAEDGGNPGPAGLRGSGGNGTGGDALLTVVAGNVNINRARLEADGYGSPFRGAGDGFGGVAKVLGGLGGMLTSTGIRLSAQGFGGRALSGRGGNGIGGTAGFEIDGISATIEGGDLIVDASGSGESSADGASGDGSGGTAYISSATGRGTLLVSGHTSVFANGLGADSLGAFAAGSGRGGTAYIDAFNGSTMNFDTAQIAAVGRGGEATDHEGGFGGGGDVRLRSSGAGSSVLIDRNVSQGVASESPAGNALLNADGIGRATFGGDGRGGDGNGGTIRVIALGGGSVALPGNPLSDPDSVGAIRMTAIGLGSGSSVEGGRGGNAIGGNIQIQAEGASSVIMMGETIFNVFGQAGSSLAPTSNIRGGRALGGTRIIQVLNGGALSLALVGGASGGRGGDGSGTGNGGSADGRVDVVDLNNGTLNIKGVLLLNNQSIGGNGNRGGDAFGDGEGGAFSAIGSTINLTPDANGQAGILLDGTITGGRGVTAGGNAFASPVSVFVNDTDILGGFLRIISRAVGGNATDPAGRGGNAIGGSVNVQLTNAALDLNEVFVASEAIGGDGGEAAGIGGDALSGIVDVAMTGSSLTDSVNQFLNVDVRSKASGGGGATGGNGTAGRSTLALTNSTITDAGNVFVSANAFASGRGGIALAGTAGIGINGTGGMTADGGIVLEAIGTATEIRNAGPGTVSFRIGSGSTAVVNAGGLSLLAQATSQTGVLGTGPGYGFGQFDIEVLGGNLNVDVLSTFVNGAAGGDPTTSRLVADGGNINITSQMRLYSASDILVRTGSGSIIGNASATENTTALGLETGSTIRIVGDGSTGTGLVGQTISIDTGVGIALDGNLTARGGAISLIARGFGPVSDRVITMAPGTRIDAGTGTVTIRNNDGPITLANIAAGRIDVRTLGASAGSNINVLAGSVLTASGSGRAIDLASLGGEVINLAGDAGLVLTGGGHYGIFAATPTGSQIGSFANYARRYNVANAAAYDTLNPGGNFAAFRIVPFLTVTPAAASRFYGSANPTFVLNFAGFLPGDGAGNITGTAQFTTLANGTSNVGQYALSVALGSLLSDQGYQFTFAPGVLNVTPRPLTVTANNLSRLYGNANPALTFTLGGLGLVNGDLLSGALVTIAGTTTGVGNIAITQGTLTASANYALTFVNGQLAITPRLLAVSADNLSKLLGTRDPALTFVLSGDGLMNGDQLSGALARDAGERVGEFAIRQGTLGAGSNYTITYVGGTLTINAPPAPPGINNPTNFVPPIKIGDQPPPIVDEDERRFGIDFPESLEAPLISEDPLLDDPVTSGGDATVYGDTAAPGAGGK